MPDAETAAVLTSAANVAAYLAGLFHASFVGGWLGPLRRGPRFHRAAHLARDSPAQASVGLGGYSVINAGTLLLDLNAADYDG
jgi:hypothetical protein